MHIHAHPNTHHATSNAWRSTRVTGLSCDTHRVTGLSDGQSHDQGQDQEDSWQEEERYQLELDDGQTQTQESREVPPRRRGEQDEGQQQRQVKGKAGEEGGLLASGYEGGMRRRVVASVVA